MKKSLQISIILVLAIVMTARGQLDKGKQQVTIEARMVETSKVFLKADFGFSFGTHSEIKYQTTETNGNETSTTVTDALKARLGTGIPLEIAGGYMLNENFGIQLGIDYFQGLTTKKTDNIFGDETKTTYSAAQLTIVPGVRAQIQAGKMVPYVEMGIEVGVINNYYEHMTGVAINFKASQTGELKTRDYGGIALGFKAAAGIEFPLSKMFSLFGQFQASQMAFSPKHGKITKYTIGGQDQLSNMPTSAKKWDWVKSIDSSEPRPTDEPGKRLRVVHSLSNVGLAFGVKLNFGKQ